MEAPSWQVGDFVITINASGLFNTPEVVSDKDFATLYDARQAIRDYLEHLKKADRTKKKTVAVKLLDGVGRDIIFESFDRKTGEPIFKDSNGKAAIVYDTFLPIDEARADLRRSADLKREAQALIDKWFGARVVIKKRYSGLDSVAKHDKAVEEVETTVLLTFNRFLEQQPSKPFEK